MHKSNQIFRTFVHYVSFNVLSMLGLSLYILADTYFVSGGVGSLGVAALNIVLPAYSLLSGISLLIGMGAATRYAILRAEGNDRQASACFTHAVALGLGIGVLFTLAGLFFSPAIAGLLGADSETSPFAVTYLQTLLSFSCAFLLNQILVCFIRNDGHPRLSMYAMLLGSFSNIILDYVFIFPLDMGMFGAAFATGLAPIWSLLLLSRYFLQKKNHFHLLKCRPSWATVSNILALGVPSFITEFSSGIIMLVFNYLILNLTGNVGVAAYGIVANLALIVVSIFTGVAQGIQPILSQSLGAKLEDQIRAVLRYALILVFGLGAMFYLIGLFAAGPIVSLFNSEQNAILQGIAEQGVRLYFLAFLLMGMNIVVTAFFSAVSRPKQSFAISITRGFAAVLPLAFCLSALFQMTGVWMVIPASEVVAAVLGVILLRYFFKKKPKLSA